MTPEEKKSAVQTSRILRVARKSRGLTQLDAARLMGVSQSALSKMESALLIPSVHQWFEFCQGTRIPADSHIFGYLDAMLPAQWIDEPEPHTFKVNPKFLENAGSTVRSMRPILNWASHRLGDGIDALFQEMKFDPDYFLEMSHPLSLQFGFEVLRKVREKIQLNSQDWRILSDTIENPKEHGKVTQLYGIQTHDPSVLLEKVLSTSRFYECNFGYSIEEVSSKRLVFSVKASSELQRTRVFSDEDGVRFLCEYRNHFFSSLLGQMTGRRLLFRQKQCSFSGNFDRCLHEALV